MKSLLTILSPAALVVAICAILWLVADSVAHPNDPEVPEVPVPSPKIRRLIQLIDYPGWRNDPEVVREVDELDPPSEWSTD